MNVMTKAFAQIVLKPKEEGRLKSGHLWAFSNEIAEAPAGIAPGSLADLVHSRSGFIWRTDSSLRQMEGLVHEAPQVLFGEMAGRIQIETENGLFWVDLLHGQKTGFYFDQRDNRQALAPFCKGKRVLDAFCYSGAFGIASARAGAKEIVFVDSSEAALQLAEANAQLNDAAERSTFVQGDALQLLAHENPKGPFDVIA